MTVERLSPHFTLREMTNSATATRLGIDNSPPQDILANLRTLASNMERVRVILGNVPVVITSAYRCLALNNALKGAKNSSHLTGLAADFVVPKFGSARQVAVAIRDSDLKFDQLIYEIVGASQWVHLGFEARMRGDVMTYRNGIYIKGIA